MTKKNVALNFENWDIRQTVHLRLKQISTQNIYDSNVDSNQCVAVAEWHGSFFANAQNLFLKIETEMYWCDLWTTHN